MTVLPQLESELLQAHARLVARRNRLTRARLARRARLTSVGPVGRTARARTWLVAGVRAAPALLAVVVTLAVVLVAFVLIGHGRHTPNRTPNQPSMSGPPPGLPTNPSPQQQQEERYINNAWITTRERDSACAPPQPKLTFSNGTPSKALLSSLGLLRRPAAPSDALSQLTGPDGGQPVLGGVYRRYIRLARTQHLPAQGQFDAATVLYYIVPARNATAQSPMPLHCYADQVAALQRELPQIPEALREPTLQLNARANARHRYDEQHTEGISVMAVSTGGGRGLDYYSANTAELAQGGAIGQGFPRGARMVVSGVVPDGVAAVTFHYPPGAVGGKTGPVLSITSRPVNNLFLVNLPIPHASGRGTPDKIVWRAANGAVIRTIPGG